MAELLYGAPVADAILEKTREKVSRLTALGCKPRLAILRSSPAEDQIAYERSARKCCECLGIAVDSVQAEPAALMRAVEAINRDESIHGCLILRPLPAEADGAALDMLSPEKDVDCVSSASLGMLFSGRGGGFKPCTALSCIALLEHYGIELQGARAVVIGRSLSAGKPLAVMLEERNATVTLCGRSTRELAALCREADILVAAAGHAWLVDAGFTRPGQIVLDVGINSVGGKTVGDVDISGVAAIAGAVTPVPGGVGAVTTALLAKHTADAAENIIRR